MAEVKEAKTYVLKRIHFRPMFPECGDDYVFGRPIEVAVDKNPDVDYDFKPGSKHNVLVIYHASSGRTYRTRHLVEVYESEEAPASKS